jgi:hypothetical protein
MIVLQAHPFAIIPFLQDKIQWLNEKKEQKQQAL